MFLHYYVDSRPHHKHEVHHEGCNTLPPMEHRQYLGMFETPNQAATMARVVYEEASNCKRCSKVRLKNESHSLSAKIPK